MPFLGKVRDTPNTFGDAYAKRAVGFTLRRLKVSRLSGMGMVEWGIMEWGMVEQWNGGMGIRW
jgi:hypothetical protein